MLMVLCLGPQSPALRHPRAARARLRTARMQGDPTDERPTRRPSLESRQGATIDRLKTNHSIHRHHLPAEVRSDASTAEIRRLKACIALDASGLGPVLRTRRGASPDRASERFSVPPQRRRLARGRPARASLLKTPASYLPFADLVVPAERLHPIPSRTRP